MKKIFLIPTFLLFISCNSTKMKGIELDSTQELIGKIKEIEVNTFYYATYKKDTSSIQIKSTVTFDKNNNIIKQIDDYSKFSEETYFNYKKKMLVSTISTSDKRVRRNEYKYDNKNNLVEYNQLENDTLYFSKTTTFDNKNNPLVETYLHPNFPKNNSTEKFSYDYKKRIATIQSYDENNKPKNHFLRIYFNKKGYTIKTESVNNKGIFHSSTTEYDKLGNLTQKMVYDSEGKPKFNPI